jgi:hypothetical protein
LLQRAVERDHDPSRPSLHVHVNVPGALIAVDGARVGSAPLADDVFVDPGQHVVRVTLAGYEPVERVVRGEKGQALDVDLALVPKASGPNLIVVISGAVLTAGALGAGIGLRAAGGSEQSSGETATSTLKQTRGASPCGGSFGADAGCQAIQQSLDSSGHLYTASTIAFVAAGALGIATVTYTLLARRKHAQTALSLRVAPALRGVPCAISLTGSF